MKQQKFSQSDPVLICQFSKKLQSDPVLIRPILASVLIQSDPVWSVLISGTWWDGQKTKVPPSVVMLKSTSLVNSEADPGSEFRGGAI